ncbi:MAG: 30S ribosomal protein S6 [Candidatus Nealsonbacteria bacterium]
MQLYQLDYLISPEASEKDAQDFGNKLKSLIESEGGLVVKTEVLIKQVLAYEIKKFNEAFLASLSFNLEPEKIEKLEKELRAEKNVLRHLLIKKKIVKIKPKRRKVTRIVKEVKTLKTKPKQKVELKEIEKKLEEILGDS